MEPENNKQEHQWLWHCDEESCAHMYCVLCFKDRDFKLDEDEEPACSYVPKT